MVVSDLTLVECDRTIIRAAVERPAARSPSNRSERSLASALIAREGPAAFALLSLDRPLREAARHAGLAVAPA